jgi:hypothetical protein
MGNFIKKALILAGIPLALVGAGDVGIKVKETPTSWTSKAGDGSTVSAGGSSVYVIGYLLNITKLMSSSDKTVILYGMIKDLQFVCEDIFSNDGGNKIVADSQVNGVAVYANDLGEYEALKIELQVSGNFSNVEDPNYYFEIKNIKWTACQINQTDGSFLGDLSEGDNKWWQLNNATHEGITLNTTDINTIAHTFNITNTDSEKSNEAVGFFFTIDLKVPSNVKALLPGYYTGSMNITINSDTAF